MIRTWRVAADDDEVADVGAERRRRARQEEQVDRPLDDDVGGSRRARRRRAASAVFRAVKPCISNLIARPESGSTSAGSAPSVAARLVRRTPAGRPSIDESSGAKRPLTKTSSCASRPAPTASARSASRLARAGGTSAAGRPWSAIGADVGEAELLVARRREALGAGSAAAAAPRATSARPARAARPRDASTRLDVGVARVRRRRSAVAVMLMPGATASCFEPAVALRLELERQLLAARLDDAAVGEHVHEVGHDVVQQPLVVRDDDDGALGAAQRVDAARRRPSARRCRGPSRSRRESPGVGSSTAIWKISLRFFSPPEKPWLTERLRKVGSISSSFIFSLTSFMNSMASSSASPRCLRTALSAALRK